MKTNLILCKGPCKKPFMSVPKSGGKFTMFCSQKCFNVWKTGKPHPHKKSNTTPTFDKIEGAVVYRHKYVDFYRIIGILYVISAVVYATYHIIY